MSCCGTCSAAARENAGLRVADRRGPRVCSCRGSPASRPEARQRHGDRTTIGSRSWISAWRRFSGPCSTLGRRRRDDDGRTGSSSGRSVGTVGYMSPEQALGKPLDARTDLFALGVILFEMATGRAPFEADTLAATFDQLLNRRPRSPLTLNPALPAMLSAVIDKALEKDPERRYRSASEFLDDLTASISSTSGRSATAGRARRRERDASLNRRAPVPGPEPAAGSGVLLPRDHRGDHQQPDDEFPGCA